MEAKCVTIQMQTNEQHFHVIKKLHSVFCKVKFVISKW